MNDEKTVREWLRESAVLEELVRAGVTQLRQGEQEDGREPLGDKEAHRLVALAVAQEALLLLAALYPTR